MLPLGVIVTLHTRNLVVTRWWIVPSLQLEDYQLAAWCKCHSFSSPMGICILLLWHESATHPLPALHISPLLHIHSWDSSAFFFPWTHPNSRYFCSYIQFFQVDSNELWLKVNVWAWRTDCYTTRAMWETLVFRWQVFSSRVPIYDILGTIKLTAYSIMNWRVFVVSFFHIPGTNWTQTNQRYQWKPLIVSPK